MAKDIKLYKGSDTITINENNLAHYLKLGYKQEIQENKVETNIETNIEYKENKYGNSSRKRGSRKNWK
jgi:hypothetical protein